MIHILASGVLMAAPQARTSAKGTTYVTGTLKASTKDSDCWISFVAFNEEAQAELLALRPGDGLAIAGPGRLTEWIGKDGQPKHGLSTVVDRLVVNHPKPKPKPAHGRDQFRSDPQPAPRRPTPAPRPAPAPAEAGLDDDIPF